MKRPALRSGTPLYCRLLHLKHVHPNSWQRAVLGEGAIAVAAILVLADLASLWILVALPLTVAAVVKGHDVLAGVLVPVDHHAADRTDVVVIASGDAAEHPPVEAPVVESPEPVVEEPAAADAFSDESAVRVIPAPSRRAAGRPGAAAARAQATAHRPQRKADG